MKVAGLVFGIALIVGAWYLGAEWWITPIRLKDRARPAPRLEVAAVILSIVFLIYIADAIERYRQSR